MEHVCPWWFGSLLASRRVGQERASGAQRRALAAAGTLAGPCALTAEP